MKTFNPIHFNHGPESDFIPANPTVTLRINPATRDNIMVPQETPQHWHFMKPRWSFSHSTGILESPFMMAGIEARELNHILDTVRSNHGTKAVKEIRVYVDPGFIDDCYTQLTHFGYVRAGHLETGKIPHLVFTTKSPRRWVE